MGKSNYSIKYPTKTIKLTMYIQLNPLHHRCQRGVTLHPALQPGLQVPPGQDESCRHDDITGPVITSLDVVLDVEGPGPVPEGDERWGSTPGRSAVQSEGGPLCIGTQGGTVLHNGPVDVEVGWVGLH